METVHSYNNYNIAINNCMENSKDCQREKGCFLCYCLPVGIFGTENTV